MWSIQTHLQNSPTENDQFDQSFLFSELTLFILWKWVDFILAAVSFSTILQTWWCYKMPGLILYIKLMSQVILNFIDLFYLKCCLRCFCVDRRIEGIWCWWVKCVWRARLRSTFYSSRCKQIQFHILSWENMINTLYLLANRWCPAYRVDTLFLQVSEVYSLVEDVS